MLGFGRSVVTGVVIPVLSEFGGLWFPKKAWLKTSTGIELPVLIR